MRRVLQALWLRIKVAVQDILIRPNRVLFPVLILLTATLGTTMLMVTHAQDLPARKPAPATLPFLPKKPAPPKPPTYGFGGRHLIPEKRLIALYGAPGDPALGILGESPDPETAAAKAHLLADTFQPFSDKPVVPAFEIITTVADAIPTDNGDYSRETDAGAIQPWIDAARAHQVYVVLDLQPGRSDFLTQAKEYEGLLKQPDVGLALDPEWRLGPTEVTMQRIGSVGIDEVNQTAAWLATLTKEHNLPQKLFLLHQFRLDMITDRVQLDTTHPELAYVIQMDGNGTQSQKDDTWHTITTTDPPAGVSFGWKNFYDEDSPMLTPEQTMNKQPVPRYISYQ
jgi:hypothetical protein